MTQETRLRRRDQNCRSEGRSVTLQRREIAGRLETLRKASTLPALLQRKRCTPWPTVLSYRSQPFATPLKTFETSDSLGQSMPESKRIMWSGRLMAMLTMCLLAAPRLASSAQYLKPSPYREKTDSPFIDSTVFREFYDPFADSTYYYFYLETFESGALHTPGVLASGGEVWVKPGPYSPEYSDSVDGDDGAVDGSGTRGRSYATYPPGSDTIQFAFNAEVLGALPTHVGFVWTDVGDPPLDNRALVTIEAFDSNNRSLGLFRESVDCDQTVTGETEEDRFFGVIDLGGIARIRIGMPGRTNWEIDHLQYGRKAAPPTVGITSPVNGAKFTVGSNIPITAAASDSDGRVALVGIYVNDVHPLAWLARGPYSAVLSNVAIGTYTITAKAKDNGGAGRTSQPVLIHVLPPNRAPSIKAPSEQQINENESLNWLIQASDPDAPDQTLSYSLAAGTPPGARVNASGLFSWTPTEAQGPSTNLITVTVTDSGTPSLSATSSFRVIVNEINQPPILAAIENQTVSAGDTLSFLAKSTDPDIPANRLRFSLDGGVVAGAQIDPDTGVFTWTPTSAQAASANRFNLRVTDNGALALSDSKTFTVFVPPLPTILLSNTAAPEGNSGVTNAVLAVRLSSSSRQVVRVDFSTADGTASARGDYLPSSGTLLFNPGETDKAIVVPILGDRLAEPNETLLLNLTNAVNARIAQRQAVVTILNDDSTVPSLSRISNLSTPEDTTTLPIAFTVSDPETPATNLVLTAVSLNPTLLPQAGIVLGGHGSDRTITLSPAQDQFGAATISLMVRDADGFAVISSFELTVTPVNDPPTIQAIAPRRISEEMPLEFLVQADDVDRPAQTLTYSLSETALPGASIHPVTGRFSWTPSEGQGHATHVITVRVTDDGAPSLSSTMDFAVEVDEVNLPPVLSGISDWNIMLGETLRFSAFVNDPDLPKNTVTFSLATDAPEGATIDPKTGVFTWTPAKAPSANQFTVQVTDNGSPALSDSKHFTVIVQTPQTPRNLSPNITITSPANQAALFPGDILIEAVARDPDGAVERVDFYAGTVLIGSATSRPFTVTQNFGVGEYVLTARATDNAGAIEISQPVNITISANSGECRQFDLRVHLDGATNRIIFGSQASFVVSVSARGECEATNVAATVELSPNLRFVEAKYTQGRVEHANGIVRFRLGRMSSASVAEMEIIAIPTQSGTMTNVARVQAASPDANADNDISSVVTTIEDALLLELVKLANAGADLEVRGLSVGNSYSVQVSVNLREWIDLTTFVATTTKRLVTDRARERFEQRYYRVIAVQSTSNPVGPQ